jgi:ferredoxin
MTQPIHKACPAYPVSIFIAGDAALAKSICREFCDKEGLCVTVTPTTYVYTGGEEAGVIVGLINYPRFPVEQVGLIYATADELAERLRQYLGQQSFTVQNPDAAFWTSYRKDTPA